MSRRIVCAAIQYGEHLLVGVRHFDKVMHKQLDKILLDPTEKVGVRDQVQGFIDNFGNFLDREEALKLVLSNGQHFDPKRNGSTTELFSEGLY